MLTFPSAPHHARHPTALVSASPESQPSPRQELNSLNFLKSPKSSVHASGAWRHLHPPVTFSIWDFYFDNSEWHILPRRAWTPALMLHLTNLCAKRKVLSLTKPKDKIYKTKSLSHYITLGICFTIDLGWLESTEMGVGLSFFLIALYTPCKWVLLYQPG